MFFLDGSIISNDGEFNVGSFNSRNDTYKAVEALIKEMKTKKRIKSYKHGKTEFLFNKKYRTILLLKCVAKSSIKYFVRKRNKKTKFKFDIGNRVTTVGVARGLILHFLNKPAFAGYSLAIPIGNTNHEACLFLAKRKSGIEAIYFNPNFSPTLHGVENSKIAVEILQCFSKKLTNIQAYHSENGNTERWCSAFTWMELYFFLFSGISPFERDTIDLTDYKHLTTQHAYDKYHKNYKKSLKHLMSWRLMDGYLKTIKTTETIDIAIEFVNILLEYDLD